LKKEVEIFEKQLALIKDDNVRSFTIGALELLPDYFWVIPASTTGKYHPVSSLGEGGLVRHTKTALKIAEELFRFTSLGDYNDFQKDCIRSAIMLHDGCKCGLKGSKYTVHEHPLVLSEHLRGNKEVYDILKPSQVEAILQGVESHMSNWNTNNKSNVVLPLPEKPYQVFIALCDYLSAQKIFNIEVDGWVDTNKLNGVDKSMLTLIVSNYEPNSPDELERFNNLMDKLSGGNQNAI